MITEAIECYHNLLTDEIAQEAHEAMQSKLRARGLYFGDRPLCTVLRPHFYLENDWLYLKNQTEILLSAFAAAHEACLVDTQLRDQLGLEAYEEELFSLDIGGPIPWTTSRLDAFYRSDTGYLRFVEYNAETPAGIGYGDLLSETFLELKVMQQFQNYYEVEGFPGLGHLLGALLHGYRQWGGQETPQIAIVDWSDVPTLNEHRICQEFYQRNGAPAVLADPRELEYRNGKLWAGDFRVDLIYKRVLISELIQRMGLDNPIVQALRDRAVMMTNSFSAKLLAKKASLAFLSDERNARLFDDRQLTVIHQHIPWTRMVAERRTLYAGQEVDLLPFIADHRERFVIKPNDEYGGKGVVLGWEATSEQWESVIRDAMSTPYVVQEKVDLVTRDFPAILDNGCLDISPRFVDADPYIFYGKTVGGCLTRLSSVSLLNVTAGGGSVVPMFVLRKKT